MTQENDEHADRAEIVMKAMDELRNRLVAMQMQGRIRQGKLEYSSVDQRPA